MPAIMASTISPKWSTKRVAVSAPAGSRNDHGLVVGCVERMCVTLQVSQVGMRAPSDRKRIFVPRLADLSMFPGPQCVESGPTKGGAGPVAAADGTRYEV